MNRRRWITLIALGCLFCNARGETKEDRGRFLSQNASTASVGEEVSEVCQPELEGLSHESIRPGQKLSLYGSWGSVRGNLEITLNRGGFQTLEPLRWSPTEMEVMIPSTLEPGVYRVQVHCGDPLQSEIKSQALDIEINESAPLQPAKPYVARPKPAKQTSESDFIKSFRVFKQKEDELVIELEYELPSTSAEGMILTTDALASGGHTGFFKSSPIPLKRKKGTVRITLTYSGNQTPQNLVTDGLEFAMDVAGRYRPQHQQFSFKKTWTKRALPDPVSAIDFKGEGRQPGDAIPDFTLVDQQAKDRRLSKLIKNRPAVLYFYSACCGHCHQEMPKWAPVARSLAKDGIVLVGITYFGNSGICKRKVDEHQLVGPVLADSDGTVCGKMGVGDFTVVAVNRKGTIVYRGGNDEKAIRASLAPGYKPQPPAPPGSLPFQWPPTLGSPYPDFEFQMQDGTVQRISDLRGKIVLIEMVGMNCPACLAWAGAEKKGTLEGITPQAGLAPIDETFQKIVEVPLDDPRVVFIQLLLFNMQMRAPTFKDVERWSTHFHEGLATKPIVLAGAPEFLLQPYFQKTYDLVPGFQLLDTKGILRYDATGHQPKHSLFTDLLPGAKEFLREMP